METPKKRILPSSRSAWMPSSHEPRPTHSSLQTWNCWTSSTSRPRLESVRSVHLRMWSAGNASSGSTPSGAGQRRFLGGILLATTMRSLRSRTTWPTSFSECPLP
jgi:hypothetical protein